MYRPATYQPCDGPARAQFLLYATSRHLENARFGSTTASLGNPKPRLDQIDVLKYRILWLKKYRTNFYSYMLGFGGSKIRSCEVGDDTL